MFAKNVKSFDPVQIPKALKDAGFTAAEVMVVAAGTLEQTDKGLQLRVHDLNRPFLLLGAQNDALTRGITLAGKKVEIRGRLLQKEKETPTLIVDALRELQ